MKTIFIQLIVVVFCLLALTSNAQVKNDNSDVAALLIENSGYNGGGSFGTLDFPIEDVKNLKNCLVDQFKIDVKTVLGVRNTQSFDIELQSFRDDCKAKGINKVIIYYSGHGTIALGEDFLIPTAFNDKNLKVIYDGPDADVTDFFQWIYDAPQDNEIDQFKSVLNNYLIVKNCIAIHQICDKFKDFEVLLVSDACRSKLPINDKGASIGNVGSESYLTQWLKNVKQSTKKKRVTQFLADFNECYQGILKTNNQLVDSYNDFVKNVTDNKQRKSVTMFFGTNFYNPARESPTDYSSVFTLNLIKTISESYEPEILFDIQLSREVDQYIAKKPIAQHTVISGTLNFVLENVSHRAITVNKRNIQRAIQPPGKSGSFFTALSINDRSFEKSNNLKTGYHIISNELNKNKIDTDEPFLTYFNQLKCPAFKINYYITVPNLQFSFNNEGAIFYAKSRVLLPSRSNYSLDSANCNYQLKGNVSNQSTSDLHINSLSSNSVSDMATMDYDNYADNEYEFTSDSTIKFKNAMEINKLDIVFDKMTINKISANFDTLRTTIEDVRPWRSEKIINLTVVRNMGKDNASIRKKKFFAMDLPYEGGYLADSLYTLTDLNPDCIKQVNNKPLKFRWTSGEYKLSITLKPEYAGLQDDSLITAETSIAHLNIDDVSRCPNPLVNCACDKTLLSDNASILGRYSFVRKVLDQHNLRTLTMNFKIYSLNPEQLKIAIPIYADHSHLKKFDISTITIQLVNTFDRETVTNQLLAEKNIRDARDSTRKAADSIANVARILSERTHFVNTEFKKTSLSSVEYDNDNRIWSNNNIQSYSITDGKLTLARNKNFKEPFGFTISPNMNYEFETEIAMDDLSTYKDRTMDKIQYIIWDGSNSSGVKKGYYLAKYKDDGKHFVEIGYKDGATDHALAKIPLAMSNSNFEKITIRKIYDKFYVFIREKYQETIDLTNYIPGDAVFLQNGMPYVISDDSRPWSNQLDYGGSITVNYLRFYKLDH